ncbi:MAG: metallophosphoesterase [Oscillospiraceae bacterium]|jgi:putative phosphoesterase|nr:metallophosphoesterase [Oscillospiraceae bacterium]
MTRIILFSDSHGDLRVLQKIVKKHLREAAAFLFLGDGEREFDFIKSEYPNKRFFAVRGNNDIMSKKDDFMTVDIAGIKIFMTHGHRYPYRLGEDFLRTSAGNYGAKVAACGHTHFPGVSYEAGIYVINPGSVSLPRAGSPRSYGILDISGAGIVPFIAKAEVWPDDG